MIFSIIDSVKLISSSSCVFFLNLVDTTPPKNILTPEMRLFDAGCVPSAMVHFGTKDTLTSGSKTYLQGAILTQLTSPSAATLAAYRSR